MLVPLNWLREYVKDGLNPDELAHRLTASGSSVEKTIQIGQGLEDLIVAKVEEVKPHPNADRLRLARVNTGQTVVEVVCGATNLEAGQHIVYAREGARIPVNMHDEQRGSFVLKKATIRGVESNGMICSVAEMGIGEDHDGILVLPESTQVGQQITEALEYPQVVFDIEVTTNRSDELSMIGIAREVSALTGEPLLTPETEKPQSTNQAGVVPVVQTEDCYRLMTQELEVTVKPSPWWMQQRLALAGMKPINNVVDITNYVMLEYGQPLHAYNAAELQGKSLIARPAHHGEQISTLDGVVRKLEAGMVVIADEAKPLGVAGIMGGEASKITDDTTFIVLEAAVFNPIAIRKAANALALRSEASRRFERSVDREMTATALARAVGLLIQHANAKVISAVHDSYPTALELKQLTLRATKLHQYLGQQVDPAQVRAILKSLGFGEAQAFGNDTDWEISVRVPSWRAHDIEEEVDLIEEVVRMVGYDQLPITLPAGEIPATIIHQSYVHRRELRHALAQAGWSEIISVSLVGEALMRQLQMPLPEVQLANPLSSEWTHLRSSVLPGLIQSAVDNIRWSQTLRLFELGATYQPNRQLAPREDLHLGLVLCSQSAPEFGLAEIKGVVELALCQLGVTLQSDNYRQQADFLQPFDASQSVAVLAGDKAVGFIGLLPPSITEPLRLPHGTFIAEMDLSDLLTSQKINQFKPLPVFPSLEEDISVIVSELTQVADVLDIIQQGGKPMLESATLSQVYRHARLGENMKSLTFHLSYRDKNKTLSSKEVSQVRQNIMKSLKKEGMHVRDK